MPAATLPVPSTPFPSHLLDTVMPTLSDTEWRVLCVVVRQTLGWEDGKGGRKERDWLTQSQLKARTGRASEAVSRAVDGLVRKGLLLVCSEAGDPLNTPQERRRCAGRMLFGLAMGVLETQQGDDTPDPSVVTKVAITVTGYSDTEEPSSVSEVRKAKTTKETKNKKNTGDGGIKDSTNGQTLSDVHRFLYRYQHLFSQRSARGEPPPMAWGRDGKLVKGLLAQYSYERLAELLERFFESDDPWVRRRGYTLSCFPTLLPRLLLGETGGRREEGRRLGATPVVRHMEVSRQWQQAGDIPVSTNRQSLFERFPELREKLRHPPP